MFPIVAVPIDIPTNTAQEFSFLKKIIIVQVQLSAFIPHHSHLPPQPSPPPSPAPTSPAVVLSMCPLYMFLKSLPLFSSITPSNLPSGYCQIVLNFNVSAYILLACLFCKFSFLHILTNTCYFSSSW